MQLPRGFHFLYFLFVPADVRRIVDRDSMLNQHRIFVILENRGYREVALHIANMDFVVCKNILRLECVFMVDLNGIEPLTFPIAIGTLYCFR